MKIVIDLSAQSVVIEGDGPEAIQLLTLIKEIAPDIPEISIVSGKKNVPEKPADVHGNGSQPSDASKQTMRQFVKGLALTNTSERITAIAFYLKAAGRPTFSPKEMGGLFTQAGMAKPTRMPVAVFETKRRFGYIENVGHGSWQIASEGENMIVRKQEEAGEIE